MLSREEILDHLAQERLFITPLLEQSQIGGGSVDLRLGFNFILHRRANIPALDSMMSGSAAKSEKYQERITLGRRRELHLHPGEFVLGATLEYIALPDFLSAYVTSRSSWGRAGLVIATAISVAPGFRGIITLELSNLGVAPLVLRPGVRIAQIMFDQTKSTKPYGGRYRCPTLPEFGKIHMDHDLKFWGGVNKPQS